jgi:hypothetical protein
MKVLRLLLSRIGPTRLAQTDQAIEDNDVAAPCRLSRGRTAPIAICDARHLCYFPSCMAPAATPPAPPFGHLPSSHVIQRP